MYYCGIIFCDESYSTNFRRWSELLTTYSVALERYDKSLMSQIKVRVSLSGQTVCAELTQPITHPSCDAAQVDIRCKTEISWNFYWSLWGNQAVAAANLTGFGRGEERREKVETVKMMKLASMSFLSTSRNSFRSFVAILPFTDMTSSYMFASLCMCCFCILQLFFSVQ